jgi:serine/threonine protein kinase
MALYSAFTAALVLQARIIQDVQRFLVNLPAEILANTRHFPAVSKLRKYPSSPEDYFTFEIRDCFPPRQFNCHLYFADTQSAAKQRVLIKFTRWYSIELHEFCANSGHAPQILAFQELPGGWFAVVMEYMKSGVPITDWSLDPAHRDRWITELQQLVDSFHDKGLVHGDLRDANIICKDRSMMLIDFDWSGKDGKVFYPTPDLHPELLRGRADLRITKEDDRRVLGHTLAKLTGSYAVLM